MRWIMQGAFLGAAILSAAGCASRPEPPGGGAARMPSVVASGEALLFVSFDSDQDYRTSRAELASGVESEWRRTGAEAMSPIAFQQWAQSALGDPDLGPFRLQFDSNVDAEITRAEFAALLEARFDDLDANDDGFVARSEMVRRLPQPRMMEPRPPMRRPPGGGMPPPGG